MFTEYYLTSSQIFTWNILTIFSTLIDLVIIIIVKKKKIQNIKYNFLKEVIRTSHKKSLSMLPKSWKSKRSGVKIVIRDKIY